MSEEHNEVQAAEPAAATDYSDQVAPAAARDVDQIVEDWWDAHIRGSVAAQSTQIWNHLMVCKDKLKDALRG